MHEGGDPITNNDIEDQLDDREPTKEGAPMTARTNSAGRAGATRGQAAPNEGLLTSRAAYLERLPELVQAHHGQWVAFHGNELVGFAKSAAALYERCGAQGIERGQVYVGRVARPLAKGEISR